MFARRDQIGWAFVAPFGVAFLLLLVLPLAYAFWLSLNTKTLARGSHFTGLGNYVQVFTDPLFLKGAMFVIVFSLFSIPIQLIVSLSIALILDDMGSRLAKLSRLLIFVPYAVPVVIGALMWGFLYSPSFGPAAQLFGAFGMDAPNLLSRGGIFWGLFNIVMWQWTGYHMIVLYSALRGVDPSLCEAARADGANKLQIALRIKVPLVSRAIVLVVVFSLIGTLQFFTEPQILRSIASGVIDSAFTPNIYAYNLAFQYRQFNYASAISFALGLVVFVASFFLMRGTRKMSGV